MYPILLLALYLYYVGFEICFRLSSWNRICSDDKTFALAYKNFLNCEFNRVVLGQGTRKNFVVLRNFLLSGVRRRLVMIKILTGVAPLLGLLGTVFGLSSSISSSMNFPERVSEGVSLALLTTQAGLVVAIPAWIIVAYASSKIKRLSQNLSLRELALLKGGVQ